TVCARRSARGRPGAGARLRAGRPGPPVVAAGPACGVPPAPPAELPRAHPLVALVHHPLALESGIPAAEAAEFHRRERAALAHTDGVIANSTSTARRLSSDYGVPPANITIAFPVTDPSGAPRSGRRNGPR